MLNAKRFFACYGQYFTKTGARIIEIGSQDVNGSLREAAGDDFEYIGVDFVPGKGVDIVIDNPYALPFESDFADIVVSSSCFEHSEMFWLVYLEILRVLKPRGLFYFNAPSNGLFHRYPVDCWRFYPDSGNALVAWGNRNGINCGLLESFISKQRADRWNDFVAVFIKDLNFSDEFKERIMLHNNEYFNGILGPNPKEILHFTDYSEDQLIQEKLKHNGSDFIVRNRPCPCGSGKRFKHCHGRFSLGG